MKWRPEHHRRLIKCLRYFILFFLLIIVGGVIFHLIEYDQNEKLIKQNKDDLEALKKYLNDNETLISYLKEKAHLLSDGTYENNWHVLSSTFFAFTIATTVGYGSFSPSSVGGQAFVLLYATVAIPLAGICFVNLSNMVLEILTLSLSPKASKMASAFEHFDTDNSGCLDGGEVFAALKELGITVTADEFAEYFKQVDVDESHELDLKEFQELTLLLKAEVPDFKEEERKVKVSFAVMFLWVLIGSLIICLIENWTYWEGIYFTYVTLTTVGLGDYAPSTLGGGVFTVIYTIVGLGIIAIVLELLAVIILARVKKARKRIKKRLTQSKGIFYNPLYQKKPDDDNNAISSNETFPEVDTAVKEEEKVNGFSKEEEIQINVVDKEKEFKVDGEENKKHTP